MCYKRWCLILFTNNLRKSIVCLLNKHDIQQNGGIGSCQKMRKKEWNQFLLIKLGKGR